MSEEREVIAECAVALEGASEALRKIIPHLPVVVKERMQGVKAKVDQARARTKKVLDAPA